MRPYIAISLLSATLLTVAAPASANGPFTRPSVTAKANPDALSQSPPPTVEAPSLQDIQSAQDKAMQEAKLKAAEERRKRYNLAEGQDAMEVPFKGARVGTVNGINVYRNTEDSSNYYFEPVAQRKYVPLPTEETYHAPAAVARIGAQGFPGGTSAAKTAATAAAPQLPSAVGRPAPQK